MEIGRLEGRGGKHAGEPLEGLPLAWMGSGVCYYLAADAECGI